MKFVTYMAFAVIGSQILACSAESGETSSPQGTNADEAQVASVGPWLGHAAPDGAATTKPESLFGGTGGHTDYVRCPNITGFFGRANVFLDAVGFACSQGSGQWPTAQFGGGGGQFFGTHPCPNGYIASGITGHAGAYVDSLALICRDNSNAAFTTPAAGGNGGNGYYFECPGGQKLIGFNLHDDVYVDGLEPVCGWR